MLLTVITVLNVTKEITENGSINMTKPTFVWSLFYPAPKTRNWRITGLDVDGQQGIYIDVLMYCDKLRHSPKLNMCQVCRQHHELPKPTDERYAYKWYPMKPGIASVIQWRRRNRERGFNYENY